MSKNLSSLNKTRGRWSGFQSSTNSAIKAFENFSNLHTVVLHERVGLMFLKQVLD